MRIGTRIASWHSLGLSLGLGLASALIFSPTLAQSPPSAIPDFSTGDYVWVSRQANQSPPPIGAPGARGPVGDHPEHPHYANQSGRMPTPRIGDDTSPILLAWAAEHISMRNEITFSGGVAFDASARCWPPGVPGILSFGDSVFILQEENQITITYQRNQSLRHIYLNQKHSEHVEPSWMGESVGHYEGDTLVVDTIGLRDDSMVDKFGTPHTEALHVVERYKVVEGSPELLTDATRPGDETFTEPGRRVLQVIATIEDPGAYTQPFSVMQLYEFVNEPFEEALCQENSHDRFNQGLVPVPTANRVDF
jgi:hypothetical protein